MSHAHQNLLLMAAFFVAGGLLAGRITDSSLSPVFARTAATFCLAAAAVLGLYLWPMIP